MKCIHETYHGTVLGGKRLIPDNPQNNSYINSVIWGHDIDMTWKGDWLAADMFTNSAGLPRGSGPVYVPPVCARTHGETTAETDTGYAMPSSSVGRHSFG